VKREALLHHAILSSLMLQGLVPTAMAQATKAPPAKSPAAPAPVPLATSLPPSARASYDGAKLLFGDADYSGALLKFTQAYEEAKDARLLWNMAACEEKLRHYAKASALVTRYVAEADANLTAQDRSDAAELIQTLATVTAPLVLTSDVPGVDITIDGEPAGTTPIAAPISVDQGTRHIVGKKDGYQDSAKELTVIGGAPASVTLTMVKVVHEARLTVGAGDHDAISLDGAVVAEGRFNGVIASGGHTLRVTAPGMRSYQTELTLTDGDTRTVSVALEAEVKPFPWWLVATGGGVLIAGAGIGGYFLFKPTNGQAPVGTAAPGTVQLSSLTRSSVGRR
jgi:PEGA domain